MLLSFLVAFIPGLLWVWFFNRQDRYEKEPAGLIARAFFYGMLAVVPAGLYESAFRSVLMGNDATLTRFLAVFFVVGIGEELSKFAAYWAATHRQPALNEPMDGIVYAVAAALGFASVENLFYGLSFGLAVVPTRALITMLAHASFTGVVGYHAAMVRLGRSPRRALWGALGLAALLHALYDFFIMSGLISPLFALIGVLALYRYLAGRIAKAEADSPFRPD